MLLHLTWRGRVSAAYYALRRLFVRPAPEWERCWMGAPVDPMVHCPRWSGDDLWCAHHNRELRSGEG